jgi:arginase
MGDDPPRLFKPDEESPRARNLPEVFKMLESFKPRVELAIKSCALPLILSGDCSVALAVAAGARRYFRHISMVWMDRDADLNTPSTTSSGCVDGMVVSHLTGHGAAELVRFWPEPPLVREPDIALFGVDRLDPPEEESIARSAIRKYMAEDVRRRGPAAAAAESIERIHGGGNEFILHFDVDVIDGFGATNYPGPGGLGEEDIREALNVFARQKHLAAVEVTAYNPAKDPDGSGAKRIIDLLADLFSARFEALKAPAAATAAISASLVSAPAAPEESLPRAEQGEAWSSDSLEIDTKSEDSSSEPEFRDTPSEAEKSQS